MMKIKNIIIILLTLITINVKAAGDISISKSNISLDVGETTTFVVNATNAAGKVDIVSTDSSVATVDVAEYFFDTSLNNSSVTVTVRAIKQGEANIEVILTDVATFDLDELTGKKICKVNVSKKEILPSSITITGSRRIEVDEDIILTSTVSPSDASQDVTWTSSDTSIATVSSNGTVHGIRSGNVVITASILGNESIYATFNVGVVKAEVYDVPKTASNVSLIVYISVILMITIACGIIYYVYISKQKKNNI